MRWFWSQNLDSSVKTVDNPRAKDLHSVVSCEANGSAKTHTSVLTLPPVRSLTDTTLWRQLAWILHIPCCSTLGFPVSFHFSFWSVTQMPNLLSFNSKGQRRHLVSALKFWWVAAQTTHLSCTKPKDRELVKKNFNVITSFCTDHTALLNHRFSSPRPHSEDPKETDPFQVFSVSMQSCENESGFLVNHAGPQA